MSTGMKVALVVLTCGTLSSCGMKSSTSIPWNVPGEDASIALLPGMGLNHLNLKAKGHCVKLGPYETQSGQTSGQMAEFRMLEVTDESALRESLNVSSSARMMTPYVVGDARIKFARSVNKNSYSKYLLIHARVANQLEIAKSFEYAEDPKALLAQGQKERFTEQCGTEFVYGRRTGGEFFTVFEFQFEEKKEEMTFSTAIRAIGAGWQGQAQLDAALAKFNMTARTQVSMLRFGGSGDFPEISNLKEYGRKFPTLVNSAGGSPVTLELLTKDYSGVKPTDIGPNPAAFNRQQKVIADLAANTDLAYEKRNSVRFVKANMDDFDNADVRVLDASEKSLSSFINIQQNAAVSCFDDINAGCVLPDAVFPAVTLPARKRAPELSCSVGYSWFPDERQCCKIEMKRVCKVWSGDICAAYESQSEKKCEGTAP